MTFSGAALILGQRDAAIRGEKISSLTSPPFQGTMEGQLRKTGGISTPHFIYDAAVAYSDIGPDQRLSHGGLLRILQEAASVASDEVGFGLKAVSYTTLPAHGTGRKLVCRLLFV